MAAIDLVEILAAHRAQALAILAAQHDEGRLHQKRREKGIGKVDGVIGGHERIVEIIVFILLQLAEFLEKVVLGDLGGRAAASSRSRATRCACTATVRRLSISSEKSAKPLSARG